MLTFLEELSLRGFSVVFLVPVSFIYTQSSFAVLILVPQRMHDVCVFLAADLVSLSSKPWWWGIPRTSQLVLMISVG